MGGVVGASMGGKMVCVLLLCDVVVGSLSVGALVVCCCCGGDGKRVEVRHKRGREDRFVIFAFVVKCCIERREILVCDENGLLCFYVDQGVSVD